MEMSSESSLGLTVMLRDLDKDLIPFFTAQQLEALKLKQHDMQDRLLPLMSIYVGQPTKSNMMQQLFIEALKKRDQSAHVIYALEQRAIIDFESLRHLLQQEVAPALEDIAINICDPSTSSPKKKFWVEMNEQHLRRARRGRFRRK